MLLEKEIPEFKKFLEKHGYVTLENSKNEYEILRCERRPNKPMGITKDLIVLYRKKSGMITVVSKSNVMLDEFEKIKTKDYTVKYVESGGDYGYSLLDPQARNGNFSKLAQFLTKLGYKPSFVKYPVLFKFSKGNDSFEVKTGYKVSDNDLKMVEVCDRVSGTNLKRLFLLGENYVMSEVDTTIVSEYSNQEDYPNYGSEPFPDDYFEGQL
jgi:hypothetical protein